MAIPLLSLLPAASALFSVGKSLFGGGSKIDKYPAVDGRRPTIINRIEDRLYDRPGATDKPAPSGSGAGPSGFDAAAFGKYFSGGGGGFKAPSLIRPTYRAPNVPDRSADRARLLAQALGRYSTSGQGAIGDFTASANRQLVDPRENAELVAKLGEQLGKSTAGIERSALIQGREHGRSRSELIDSLVARLEGQRMGAEQGFASASMQGEMIPFNQMLSFIKLMAPKYLGRESVSDKYLDY